MFDEEPESAPVIRGFFDAYWARVRQNLWGEVHESVVPVLLGRFEHHVTLCPDGVIIVMQRASTDSYAWLETSQSILELAEGQLRETEIWGALEVDKLLPGNVGSIRFDLDVAMRRIRDDEDVPFDRDLVRFVPFHMDARFWAVENAEEIATLNLAGPAS